MTGDNTSISRACKIVAPDRSMFDYKSVKDDSEVEAKLMEYVHHIHDDTHASN